MKLSEITAKLTCIKGKAVRVLAAGLLAGAVLTAAAPAAQAQRFAFGVQFGGPRYYAPPPPPAYGYGYGYGGYYEHRRWEEERAREAYYHHREWREGYGRPYGYGRGY
jgi:hypothetical protein